MGIIGVIYWVAHGYTKTVNDFAGQKGRFPGISSRQDPRISSRQKLEAQMKAIKTLDKQPAELMFQGTIWR